MENKTGMESPQSINITLYYKGFAMQVTKRDPDVSVIALITESMKGIDWAIAQGLKPSWNDETNKTALGGQKSAQQANTEADWLEKPVEGKMCPIHPNQEMKAREGKFGTFYSHSLGKDTQGKWLYCNGKVK